MSEVFLEISISRWWANIPSCMTVYSVCCSVCSRSHQASFTHQPGLCLQLLDFNGRKTEIKAFSVEKGPWKYLVYPLSFQQVKEEAGLPKVTCLGRPRARVQDFLQLCVFTWEWFQFWVTWCKSFSHRCLTCHIYTVGSEFLLTFPEKYLIWLLTSYMHGTHECGRT